MEWFKNQLENKCYTDLLNAFDWYLNENPSFEIATQRGNYFYTAEAAWRLGDYSKAYKLYDEFLFLIYNKL